MFKYSTITQIINSWIPMIGDQYISSRINTVLYGCSLVVAILKWKDLKHTQAPLREQYLWLFIIFILFALGVNKQLNLQTLLLNVGRHIAQYEGWMGKHRLFQAWFAYTLSGIVRAGLGKLDSDISGKAAL